MPNQTSNPPKTQTPQDQTQPIQQDQTQPTPTQTTPTAEEQGQVNDQAGSGQAAATPPSDPNRTAEQPSPPTVTLTLDELDARIAAGIAAANQRVADGQKAAALVAELAAKATTAPVVKSTWPYGNKDRKEEFDLSKLTTLTALPDDKVIIAIPAFNTNSKGVRLGVDMENTRIQYLDPEAYKAASKTDAETGTTTFQLLAVEPIVLHKPASQA